MKQVLGVDPGIRNTGWAVLEIDEYGPNLKESGIIKTSPKSSIADRIATIVGTLRVVDCRCRSDRY